MRWSPPWPTNDVSEYPIKVRPSAASRLVDVDWHYEPSNLGHYPKDVLVDSSVQVQLRAIAAALAAAFPAVLDILTPQHMVEQLQRHGESAWCEARWLADYTAGATSSD